MTFRGVTESGRLVATAGQAGSGVADVVGYSRLALGRIAQRESARFTRGRSLVRSQVRPLNLGQGEPAAASCILTSIL